VRDLTGEATERTVTSPRCADAAKSAALLVALSLDDAVVTREEAPPTPALTPASLTFWPAPAADAVPRPSGRQGSGGLVLAGIVGPQNRGVRAIAAGRISSGTRIGGSLTVATATDQRSTAGHVSLESRGWVSRVGGIIGWGAPWVEKPTAAPSATVSLNAAEALPTTVLAAPTASTVVRQAPAQARATPEAHAPSPDDELTRLRRAKTQLAARDPASALETLDAYARNVPNGTLGEEATALRIDALFASGDAAVGRAARSLAFPRALSEEPLRAACPLRRGGRRARRVSAWRDRAIPRVDRLVGRERCVAGSRSASATLSQRFTSDRAQKAPRKGQYNTRHARG
jgi:hypothetical protein